MTVKIILNLDQDPVLDIPTLALEKFGLEFGKRAHLFGDNLLFSCV